MRFRSQAPRARGGFTLIEVLAALTILATALFVLIDAHYSALSLHVQIDEELTFRQLVMLTAGRAEVSVLQGTLSEEGDFGMRYPDFSWTFEATAMDATEEDQSSTFSTSTVPVDLIPLYEVTATVTGPEESRTISFYVINSGVPQEEDANRMFKSSPMFKR